MRRDDELMRRLGVGRTPVREAIQRDGFVTVLPRGGTLVSETSLTDLAGTVRLGDGIVWSDGWQR